MDLKNLGGWKMEYILCIVVSVVLSMKMSSLMFEMYLSKTDELFENAKKEIFSQLDKIIKKSGGK